MKFPNLIQGLVLVLIFALPNGAKANGDEKPRFELGKPLETCQACDDKEYRDDLEKLKKRYGADVAASAKKAGLDLADDEIELVLEGVLAGGKAEACKFSFLRVQKNFSSAAEKSNYLEKDVVNRSIPIFAYTADSKVVQPTEETRKIPVPPVDIPIPQLKNPFPDCVSNQLSGEGKKQFEQMKTQIFKHLDQGGTFQSIDIDCSASTYSNASCSAKDFPEYRDPNNALILSERRCDYLKGMLVKDVNQYIEKLNSQAANDEDRLKPIAASDVKTHPEGENKDGTSGPLPPDGTNSCSIYGNGEEPHPKKTDYDQYKYANVRIIGDAPMKFLTETVRTPGSESHTLSFFEPHFRCTDGSSGRVVSSGDRSDKVNKKKRLPCVNLVKQARKARKLAAKRQRIYNRQRHEIVDRNVQINAAKTVKQYNSTTVQPVNGGGGSGSQSGSIEQKK